MGPDPHQALTMLLVQQLHLLQHVLAHLGEAGAGLLAAAQDQAVFVVACADPVQGLPEGLGGEGHIRDLGGAGSALGQTGRGHHMAPFKAPRAPHF